MKQKLKYLSLFLILAISATIHAESFRLSYETISASAIEKDVKYEKLRKFDPGQPQTIIRIHGLPSSESFFLKWKRPLFVEKDHKKECGRETFVRLQEFLGDQNHLFVLSGGGFFPGEKVTFILESLDGKFKSDSIALIPNPIILESTSGKAKIKVEVPSLSPTVYEVYLEGLSVPEEINVRSVSSGEVFDENIFYKKNSCLAFSPAVIGKNGGFFDITITREKGEQFKLHLPWGDETRDYVEGKCHPITMDFTPVLSQEKPQNTISER